MAINKANAPKSARWLGFRYMKQPHFSLGPSRRETWDEFYLGLAQYWAQHRSKDPSTKCGSIIVRPDNTQASAGYNGFPRGVSDDPALYEDRAAKYPRVVHAETNAILNAREPLHGYTLYIWPFMTCERCATNIIQAGIKRVVSPEATPEQIERWGESFKIALALYAQAGVTVNVGIATSVETAPKADEGGARAGEGAGPGVVVTGDDWHNHGC